MRCFVILKWAAYLSHLFTPIAFGPSLSPVLLPVSISPSPSPRLRLSVSFCLYPSACILLPAYDHQSDSANFLGRCAATGMFLHFVAPYYEMF